jgi:hypothetical protein
MTARSGAPSFNVLGALRACFWWRRGRRRGDFDADRHLGNSAVGRDCTDGDRMASGRLRARVPREGPGRNRRRAANVAVDEELDARDRPGRLRRPRDRSLNGLPVGERLPRDRRRCRFRCRLRDGLGLRLRARRKLAWRRFATTTTTRRRAMRPSTASAATVTVCRPSPTLCVFQSSPYGAARSRLTTRRST